MAISTSCPDCQTSYLLPDTQHGKHVRCKQCGATFRVSGSAEVPTLEAATADDIRQAQRGNAVTDRRAPRFSDEIRERPPRRRVYDDEDDYPPKKSGLSAGLIAGIAGGVFMLLVIAGGLTWYFASGDTQTATTQPPAPVQNAGQPPVNTPPIEVKPPVEVRPPEPIVPPKDMTMALTMLRSDDLTKKRLALEYLKTATVQESQRDEVSKALNGPLDDINLRRDALAVVPRWVSRHNTDRLIDLVGENDGQIWEPALRILARMTDENAIESVAKQLVAFARTSQAGRALRLTSPRLGEKYVVKYLHHTDGNVRDEVAGLLKHYRTPTSVMIEQTLSDLDLKETRTRVAGCEWLGKQVIEKEKQTKVAQTLEGLLGAPERDVRVAAIKALDKWATKDNVKALCAALGDNDLQANAVALLGRLKDDESITPLALYLNSPQRDAIGRVLIAFGEKAEKATQIQLTNGDAATRRVACAVLAEVGTKESVKLLTEFAKADRVNRDIAQAALKKIKERMK